MRKIIKLNPGTSIISPRKPRAEAIIRIHRWLGPSQGRSV